MNPRRLFCDTGVLVRYFADDDPPRALAAARLVDGEETLVVSTAAIIELVHVLRTDYGIQNPMLGDGLIRFLTRDNVELVDADQGATVAAIRWSLRVSARRIADAILAAAAEHARSDAIATFDERMESPTVPIQLL
jgi:predicted nucleic acid-binding protein